MCILQPNILLIILTSVLRACRDEKAIGYITSVWTDAVQPLIDEILALYGLWICRAWQNEPIDRKIFINNYCRIMYPGISELMSDAFKKMSESEDFLAKCLGRHTLSEMWEDPFSSYHLKNTNCILMIYKNARIAAETAQENLFEALTSGKQKILHLSEPCWSTAGSSTYTASRFIWAKTIVDRWNWIYDLKSKGKKDHVMYYDINYSTHGLIVDMMDYCTEIKEEYRKAWLSENMTYRMGTITGRFDSEYLLWRNMYSKIGDYINHNEELSHVL